MGVAAGLFYQGWCYCLGKNNKIGAVSQPVKSEVAFSTPKVSSVSEKQIRGWAQFLVLLLFLRNRIKRT